MKISTLTFIGSRHRKIPSFFSLFSQKLSLISVKVILTPTINTNMYNCTNL